MAYTKHWADAEERGAEWGPALMGFVYRTLGRTVCMIVMVPVVLYFYTTGKRQRGASLDYLARVWRLQGRPDRPNHWHALRHFFAFGESLVDKFGAWIGQIDRPDIEAIDGADFEAMHNDTRGLLVISAHLGAVEIVRAIAYRNRRRNITIVMHTPHARHYNALLERFAPDSQVSIVQPAEFDVASAMTLSAAVERGDWVVIMGDRMPVQKSGRSIIAPFLGSPAQFPLGPFLLAGTLRCPVYTLFCIKRNGRYRIHASKLSEGLVFPRRERQAALEALVRRFSAALEGLALSAPYQWFNFYDYWAFHGDPAEHS